MTASPLSRLLVVEDDPDVLEEVAGFLRRRGECVVTASSYADAIHALDNAAVPIGVLLTDAGLPDGSGVDLVRTASSRPHGPPVCILMTGYVQDRDAAGLRACGVTVVLKPFRLADLYTVVRAAIDGGGRSDQAPGHPR